MPRAIKSFGYSTLQRLVGDIAKAADPKVTREQAATATDQVMLALGKVLAHGQLVRIPGLGTFTPTTIKGRMGRDPRNGNPAAIPTSGRVNFRAAATIREAIVTAKGDGA